MGGRDTMWQWKPGSPYYVTAEQVLNNTNDDDEDDVCLMLLAAFDKAEEKNELGI